ncbi:hypothetical protein F2Q70_00036034 [Brassica cretica]|uniref:Uncharacterized protein n=1 Tax=Brassica cretica TaxID=69181 RepID=A0A8S9K1I0_BRACR|nr:hypothetical protein F2Q70_00036034 [Brassica cretica]
MNGVGGQQLQTSFEELAGKEYVFQIRNSSNNQAPVVEGEDGEAAASASNNAAAGDDEPNLLKRKRIVTNARLIDSSKPVLLSTPISFQTISHEEKNIKRQR